MFQGSLLSLKKGMRNKMGERYLLPASGLNVLKYNHIGVTETTEYHLKSF